MAEITPDQNAEQTGPSTDIQRPYPNATRVEDGIAYDAAGKQIGSVDESTMQAPGAAAKPKWDPNAPMQFASQPSPTAKPKWDPKAPMQFQPPQQPTYSVDEKDLKPHPMSGLWDHITAAVNSPNTALGSPEPEDQKQERSGLWDILTGEGKKGLKKIWDSEKIDANNIVPGSPAEWAIRQFDPEFHGLATKEAIEARKAANPNPGEKPLIDIAQFIDLKKHPIAKALTEVAQGFTSPENIAIMYATGGLGLLGKTPQALKALGTINRLVSAGFAFQSVQSAYEHSKAFKEAFDAGDAEKAEYELTHAVAAGVITAQAGTHAAEGKYKVGGKTLEIKPAIEASPTEKRVIGAVANVVGKAADATTDFAKEKLQGATDRIGAAFGKTADFDTAVSRVANMMGKKAGPEFQEKVKTASNDLKEIVNNDTANKIKDPKSAADAIDQHLQANIEAPLLRESGATKESTEPVVPDFNQRLRERLDKFFEENAGKYGSNEQEEAIKTRVIERLTRQEDLGNGVVLDRAPNLYEAENARQGLNKSAGDVFEHGTSNGYRAASADAANFMREVIDDAYKAKGVKGVPEARAKEAALIDIKEALNDAQGIYEKQKATPAILKLFGAGKLVGMMGAIGAHFLSSDVLGGALAAGTLWKTIHEHNVSNVEGNIERMKELAGREQGAKATTPQFGQTPPQPQGPAGTGPFTPRGTPPEEPLPPNVPPRPQPPEPAARPETNHNLNGVLSSYFNEIRGTTPYPDLLDKFKAEFNTMKAEVFRAKVEGKQLSDEQAEQWDRANKVNEKVNLELAREDAAVEKENEKRQSNYQKELNKWNAKFQTEKAKAEEAKKANADAESQAKIQAENDRIAAILKDERVAHSPLMKSTEPAVEIGGVEGRSSKQNHEHEHGHVVAATAEGLNPIAFISNLHPEAIEDNAAAQIHTDLSKMEKGGRGIEQRVIAMLGGPAWDDVHYGMKPGRNIGASSDIAKAREILREQAGLYGNRLDRVFDVLYDKAKEHVSNPEAIALVQANAPLREAGLHENYHMSPGRMEEYVKKLQGVFKNGQTPTTEGVHEGDTDEGLSEGESAQPGAGGEEQNGAAEEPRSEAVRKSDEGSAKPEVTKFKGGTNAAGNEATARKATTEQKVQSLVDDNQRLKSLLRDNKGTPEEQQAARVRMEENNKLMDEMQVQKSNLQLPPERTTGEHDDPIKEAGAVPAGIQKGFEYVDKATGEKKQYPDTVLFNDPQSGTTLALKSHDVTAERVRQSLENSRAQYAAAAKAKEQAAAPAPTKINYVRNPEKAPNFGERFGQHIEPAGRYLNEAADGITAPKGWETGSVEFKKPLVLDWGGQYSDATNWKQVLSKRYGGKTGEALSDAIRKDGYDGIITKDSNGETSEIVDLTGKSKAERQPLPEGHKFVEMSPEEHRAEMDKNPQAATLSDATPEQKTQSLIDDNARLKDLLRSGKGTPEERDAAIARMEENNKLIGEIGKPDKASLKKAAPPERPTGDKELDEKIKKGGAIPAGRMGPLAMFHHPETGSTLALKPEDITPETVREHVGHSTEAFTQGDIRNTARDYNAARGLPDVNPAPVMEDPRINKIADAYDKLEHAPNDPKVKASYDAFKKELDAQYDALEKSGFKFDTSKEDPYPSYEAMRKDILRNKHLTAWEGAAPPADHPLAERDPKTGMTYNEKFRLVHDVLGHAAHDADFSGNGEESAWNYHRQMFSPEAQPALAAETRGQVASFTKNGKFPDTQKAVLMPDEFNKRPEELPETGIEKSNLSKTKAKEALDKMRDVYGETDKATIVHDGHIFITPEGKFIDVGDHSDAIATHAGYTNAQSTPRWDNRPEFINKSGAVRSYSYNGRAGDNLSFSVPKDGVTEAQVDAMRRAVKEGLSRNGNLIVERADVTGDTMDERTRKKEFPRDGDVDRMLREIDAHPGGKSETAPVAGEKTRADVASANQAATAAAENAAREREAKYNQYYTPGGRLRIDKSNLTKTADDIKPENLNIDLEKHPAGGINPFTGSMDSKRYGVEVVPENREVLDHKPTAADFHRFAVENANVLSQHPDLKVGWDTLGDKPEMNIGVSTDSLDAAKKIGEKLDQRAIWDTQEGKEVPTGGKGQQTQFPDYPMAARLADLDKGNLVKGSITSPESDFQDLVENGGWISDKGTYHAKFGDESHEEMDIPGKKENAVAVSPAGDQTMFRVNQINDKTSKLLKDAFSQLPSGQEIAIDFGKRSADFDDPEKAIDWLDNHRMWAGSSDKSNLVKGSTVPLMKEPLEIEGSGEKGRVSTLDVAQALNEYSKEKNPALQPGADAAKMVGRAKKIAEDEAKYQLASGKTGTEWYTEEMKDHDKALMDARPELLTGDKIDTPTPWPHSAKLSLFKAAEAILSSGQKPYGNFKAAVKVWDAYNETGEFPLLNPATGKSWGPRGEATYGNALGMLNQLISEKGEKGAADWLLTEHPVSELKNYNEGVKGKKDDMVPGAMILGAKRGPFMQNLHGIESAFTADMWVSRTWNRWMGTIEIGKDKDGVDEIKSDSPRNGTERDLMKKSFSQTAEKLGLSTSSLQAVLWYYEQALYSAHGVPKESWSFRDAAKRAMSEENTPEQEQFNFGENADAKEQGVLSGLGSLPPMKSNFVKLKP